MADILHRRQSAAPFSVRKLEILLNQNNNLKGRIECDLKSWPCQVILALLGNSRGPLPHTTDTLIHLRIPRPLQAPRTFSTHSSMPRKLYEHYMAPARSFHSVLPARSLHAPAAPCTLAARFLAYSCTLYPIRRALDSRSYYMCRPSLLLLVRSPRSYYMISAPCT